MTPETIVKPQSIFFDMKLVVSIIVNVVIVTVFFIGMKDAIQNLNETTKRLDMNINRIETDSKLQRDAIEAQITLLQVQVAVLKNEVETRQNIKP